MGYYKGTVLRGPIICHTQQFTYINYSVNAAWKGGMFLKKLCFVDLVLIFPTAIQVFLDKCLTIVNVVIIAPSIGYSLY